MADDLYPYSGRNGGAVTDAEHELLWAALPDGFSDVELATNSMSVTVASNVPTIAPGVVRIAGHVLKSTSAYSPPVGAVSSGQVRQDLLVAYVDRSGSTWAYGRGIRAGSPGGGAPSPARTATRTEVPLALIKVETSGVTFLSDQRPRFGQIGTPSSPGTGSNTPVITALALTSPWTNFSPATSGYQNAVSCVYPNGEVRLSGAIAGGTIGPGIKVATLPEEAIPTRTRAVFLYASGGIVRSDINTLGELKLTTSGQVGAPSNSFVSLETVSYQRF